MYSNGRLNSKMNRFGLLIILLLLLASVFGYAFFVLKNSKVQTTDQMVKTGASGEKNSAGGLQLHSDGAENQDFSNNKDPDGFVKVSGHIIELANRAGGKWVKISVNDIDNPAQTAPGASGEKPKNIQPSFKEYLFFFSDTDTKGAKDIKGGEFVIVYSQRPPSEKEYVFAKKMEVKIEN